jgi:hypothetical protein
MDASRLDDRQTLSTRRNEKGWLGVSADEADALALRLTEMASEVRALRQQ